MKNPLHLFILLFAFTLPLAVNAGSHDEGGGDEPLPPPASNEYTILGLVDVVGRDVDFVNSQSTISGTGLLENTTLSYIYDQSMDNILGLTIFTVEGEIDVVTGLGEERVTSCNGVDVVCNSVDFNQLVGLEALTMESVPSTDAFLWTFHDVFETGFGLADAYASFSATEASLTPIAPMPLGGLVYSPEVPVPGAAWFFGSALIGVVGIKKRR